MLGGLADRQVDVTQGGVPILSAIPLIGGLFGRRVERETETELFLFLTPRVIRTDDELRDITREVPERAPRVGDQLRKSGWLDLSRPDSTATDSSGVDRPRSRRGRGRGR